MGKILVTGATGFIGLELSKLLEKPVLLVRRPSRAPLLSSLDATIRQGDLASPESLKRACKGVDTIIHLGARAVFEEYSRVKATIVDGTRHLMEAAKEAGVKRFVYASSLLVYDSQEMPIDQNTQVNPQCGYGVAKVEAEALLQKMAKEAGISLAIIRLPHVYGPGDLMFDQVRSGRIFFPGNGKNHFAHLHVHDAARVLKAAAYSDWEGVSSIADDLAVSWNTYFDEIRKYYPRFHAHSVPRWFSLLITRLYYPFRMMREAPSVYTQGSVTSWNLNLPVKKGLLWDELSLKPQFSTIYEGIPAVLDASIPFRWVHPVKDRLG